MFRVAMMRAGELRDAIDSHNATRLALARAIENLVAVLNDWRQKGSE